MKKGKINKKQKSIFQIIFLSILILMFIYSSIISLKIESIQKDLKSTKEKTELIVQNVRSNISAPIEGLTELRKIEKNVNYLEIKGNKTLENCVFKRTTKEMLHKMWGESAEVYIYLARLDIAGIIIEREGLTANPELVQNVLCELDQEVPLFD